MKPRSVYTASDLKYWSENNPRRALFTPPRTASPDDVMPCPALVTRPGNNPVVRVAWELDEIELAELARGGTLWLSIWGGLPPHMLEVQPPPSPLDGWECDP